jgi:hypothetical protein
VQLETDKTVYHTREPIKVRITIRNIAESEYGVRAFPPWLLSDLIIVDAQGKTVTPSVTPTHPGFRGDSKAWGIAPGKRVVPGYYALGNNVTFQEWVPIAFWGYELAHPGFYTVVVTPKLVAWPLTSPRPDYSKFPNAAPSTPVRIQVVL